MKMGSPWNLSHVSEFPNDVIERHRVYNIFENSHGFAVRLNSFLQVVLL